MHLATWWAHENISFIDFFLLQPFGIYTYDWMPNDPMKYAHVKSIKQFFDLNPPKYSTDDLSEYRKAVTELVLLILATKLNSFIATDTLREIGQAQSINSKVCRNDNSSMMDLAKQWSNSCELLVHAFFRACLDPPEVAMCREMFGSSAPDDWKGCSEIAMLDGVADIRDVYNISY